jgi:peptidoglycan/LPS O-acetylase OafA/YrhL
MRRDIRPSPDRRIRALDGLRGIAAVMVLLHHALLMLPDFANWEWFGAAQPASGVIEWLLLRTPLALIWSGQARAIIFFALSGFVLSLPWLDGRAAPYGSFLLNRFCRIYPPYLIAMTAAALACLLLGGHPLPDASIYFNTYGWAFPLTWSAIPNLLAINTNTNAGFVNEAIWSLMWEVRIYLIFPLLILPILRWRNRGLLLSIAGLLIARELAERLIPPAWTSALAHPADTLTGAIIFLFGTAVALNRRAIVDRFRNRHQTWGLTLLAAGLLVCWIHWPLWHTIMIGLGAAAILAAILATPRLQSWMATRPLLWLGRRSYSLYLIHVPLIMTLETATAGHVTIWSLLVFLAAALALADLFHRLVERPSVALARRLTGTIRPPNLTPRNAPRCRRPCQPSADLTPGLPLTMTSPQNP